MSTFPMTEYYVEEGNDYGDSSDEDSQTADDDVETRLARLEAERGRVATILSTMTTQHDELKLLVHRLMEFYCTQKANSNEACSRMFA